MNNLTRSMEDYLEVIYLIEKSKGVCRITDIAEQMLISKASVNKAVRLLKQSEFLIHERYSTISLTELGKKTAQDVYEKHTALLNFFTKVLNVPFEIAQEEACKIEHVISKETLNKLIEYANFPV